MAEGLGKRQIASALNFIFGGSVQDTPAGVVFVGLSVGDPGDDGQSGAGRFNERARVLVREWRMGIGMEG